MTDSAPGGDNPFDPALLAKVRAEALERGLDLYTYLRTQDYPQPVMFGLLKADSGDVRKTLDEAAARTRKAKANGAPKHSQADDESKIVRLPAADKRDAKPKHAPNPKGAPEPTDDRIADVFAEEHRNDLRYVAAWGKWFEWRGGCWREEKTLRAFHLIRETCRAQGIERASMAKMVGAVQTLARADRRLAATIEQWDADPMLLNTPDGVIDLKTGDLRPHRPSDYMTMITAVGPRGDCPKWKAFLHRVSGGDEALIAYLQRVAGYCLTGLTSEQAMFFGYGVGANGKGTFLHTIGSVLGDYCKTAAIETFTESKSDRHPTELARLHGARLVVATETEKGRHWAEARIKMLTGGDVVTAHFMRMDDFEYTPRYKLFFSGNHKPGLRSVGEAMRRRVNMIPFDVVIPKGERDVHLEAKLRDEWPGILQWMIDGCLDWQERELAPPEAVTTATDEYFTAQDSFSLWVEDRCERDPTAWTKTTELFASWKDWAEKAGVRYGTMAEFGETLTKEGFIWRHTGIGNGYRGLRVRQDLPPPYWQDAE
jgi:putative DNA primase/helicase